jgi:acetate kinase
MKPANPRILTTNGGSSSIKFALFEAGGSLRGVLEGSIERIGLSAKHFNEMVNFQSGLLGISETSSDRRDLLECGAKDLRAAEAVALFCYQAKKCVAAALGGLDTLVFPGGIGENAAIVRARIGDGLGFLGVALEEKRNGANEGVISSDTRRISVRVLRTDEALMIARAA